MRSARAPTARRDGAYAPQPLNPGSARAPRAAGHALVPRTKRAANLRCARPAGLTESAWRARYISMRITITLRCLFCLLCGATAISCQADSVTVFAAASLMDSLKKIAAGYEASSQDKIVFNFAGSSVLARQIEEGAPADIFFSADEAQMDQLQKRELIAIPTRVDRLANSLVIIVSADSSIRINAPDDLARADVHRIALADPKAVPAGVYAKEYLQRKNLWRSVEAKVVPTANVRGALAAVESGDIEAAIVYKTDAAISKKVKVALEILAADGPKITYPMAELKGAPDHKAARRFMQFLQSPKAGHVFTEFGFVVLDKKT